MTQKKLKIAIVAPPFGSTGGPEIATQNLVDGLLSLGQAVTLFAPSDWTTRAKHIHTLPRSLWNMSDFLDQDIFVRRNYIMASQTKALLYDAEVFDVFHFNAHCYAAAVGVYMKTPHILTLHNRLGGRSAQLNQINQAGFHTVAITKSQKGTLPITQIIPHGIPVADIVPSYEHRESYLISIGRITDQKGIHHSIRIAKKAQKKLIIIGRIDSSATRKKYYNKEILPHIDGDQIIHIPHASREEVYQYLRDAEALLFPIIRPEVFGLVVAEALACGTPVIATATDPLPEILPDDSTIAVLSNDIAELARCAKDTQLFDRKKCRLFAENHFDNTVMAQKYINLYNKII